MSFEQANRLKQQPAFKDLSDEQWLKTAKQFYPNCKDLQCKDGILFSASQEPKDPSGTRNNEQTLQQRT